MDIAEDVKAQKGPSFTDFDGDLDGAIPTCTGCQYLWVHDFHYPYCSAPEREDGRTRYFSGSVKLADQRRFENPVGCPFIASAIRSGER